MISRENYEIMKTKYRDISSWAIWTPAGGTPKSNTSDMSWIDATDLLDVLDSGFVFVGLNWSSTHGEASGVGKVPWANFHSGYSRQNDYKLRYALTGTKYWGSYITDIIKLYEEVDSNKVDKYLKQNPDVVIQNIRDFEEEISFLSPDPVLVALGSKAYEILRKHLGHKYRIVQVKHYSYTIGKEDYRDEVLKTLDNIE